MSSTSAAAPAEVLAAFKARGAPVFVLDFLRWAGPRLVPLDSPEAFVVGFQLCLSELAEGRSASGASLRGSLVRQPLRFYAAFALLAPHIAEAFRGPAFGAAVAQAHIDPP